MAQFIGAAQGKNFPLSPAATDLGLGDDLVNQVQSEVADRKKKLLNQGSATQSPGAYGASTISPAVMTLLGPGLGTK
jgi:hypothetical protein